MGDYQYEQYLASKDQEYESLCKRCGACCGAFDGAACQHLARKDDLTYHCQIYGNRFGIHKTLRGEEFLCVPIRNILSKAWAHDWNCGYKKTLRY